MKQTGIRRYSCGLGFTPDDVGARLVRALDPGAVEPRPYN